MTAWPLAMNNPEHINALDSWKMYQAQSKAGLLELPTLEEAERILAMHSPEPIVSWQTRLAAWLRRGLERLRPGRRNDEVQP